MKRQNTLRQWLVRYVCLLILPFILVIIVIFMTMISGLSYRSVRLSQTAMQLYTGQLSESIRNMERILVTTYNKNADLSSLCVSENDNQVIMAKIAYSDYLNQQMLIFERFHGMFTLVDRNDGLIYIDSGTHDRDIVRTEMESLAAAGELRESLSITEWFVREIDGNYYLMRVIGGNGCYCGAWLCLESLAERIKEACGISSADVAVTECEGSVISGTSETVKNLVQKYSEDSIYISDRSFHEYTATTTDLFAGILRFYLFVPTSVILKDVHMLELVFCAALGMAAILLGLFWKRMEEKIIIPCVELEQGMSNIETDEPLPAHDGMLKELEQIRSGFNRMKSRIRSLTILSYEQKLREQRIHMEYLFGQIQPHFFLNTLNVIYSFAEIERYDLIQKLSLALVRYLRYVFNNGSRLVALKDELSHVDDFIEIQKIRYPDRIIYETDIEAGMEDTGILPFLLQTFVENSIKYGINEEQMNHLRISCGLKEDKVVIRISDTGKGFSEEQIREINGGKEDEGVYRVGIRNTRQRLQLMYGTEAQIAVGNGPERGAVVTITFPNRRTTGEKETEKIEGIDR